MDRRQFNRSSSHVRLAHARNSKPGLHRRGHSYNTSPSATSLHSGSKSGSASSKKVSADRAEDEDDGAMASFLQFCATCEKQIATPSISILYCSEACRKKDLAQSLKVQTTLPPSTMPSPASYFDIPVTDIIPQRSPTIVRPLSVTFADLSLSETDSSREDYDQGNSEAARYLAQFHPEGQIPNYTFSRRPRPNRASTATESGIPSLTHTPASSVGTVASMDFYRPLRPRHDPLGGHYPTKSIDLVTPTYYTTTSGATTAPSSPTQLMKDSSLKASASTLTSFQAAEAENLSYAKRLQKKYQRQSTGSLNGL